jgi:hypothetical protein
MISQCCSAQAYIKSGKPLVDTHLSTRNPIHARKREANDLFEEVAIERKQSNTAKLVISQYILK